MHKDILPRVGLQAVGLGAVLQVGGLAWDVRLHAEDPTLAGREGPLTLSNLGHAAFFTGLILTVLGAFTAVLGPRLIADRRTVRGRVLVVAAPLLAIVLVAGTTALAANANLGGAGHTETSTIDGYTLVRPIGLASSHGSQSQEDLAAAEQSHAQHGVAPHVAIKDPKTQQLLADQLAITTQAALAHPTAADAQKDGYRPASPYIPGLAAHWINQDLVDGTWDLAHPENILYDGNGLDARVVGVSYIVKADKPPAGFAGPNDHWHKHDAVCLDDLAYVIAPPDVTSQQACEDLGGIYNPAVGYWVLHVATVPGRENPWGIFAAVNPDLDGRVDWKEVLRPGGLRDQAEGRS